MRIRCSWRRTDLNTRHVDRERSRYHRRGSALDRIAVQSAGKRMPWSWRSARFAKTKSNTDVPRTDGSIVGGFNGRAHARSGQCRARIGNAAGSRFADGSGQVVSARLAARESVVYKVTAAVLSLGQCPLSMSNRDSARHAGPAWRASHGECAAPASGGLFAAQVVV